MLIVRTMFGTYRFKYVYKANYIEQIVELLLNLIFVLKGVLRWAGIWRIWNYSVSIHFASLKHMHENSMINIDRWCWKHCLSVMYLDFNSCSITRSRHYWRVPGRRWQQSSGRATTVQDSNNWLVVRHKLSPAAWSVMKLHFKNLFHFFVKQFDGTISI